MVGRTRNAAGKAVWIFSPALIIWICSGAIDQCRKRLVKWLFIPGIRGWIFQGNRFTSNKKCGAGKNQPARLLLRWIKKATGANIPYFFLVLSISFVRKQSSPFATVCITSFRTISISSRISTSSKRVVSLFLENSSANSSNLNRKASASFPGSSFPSSSYTWDFQYFLYSISRNFVWPRSVDPTKE